MQKITPNLWFDTQALEAAKTYTSIFKNSSINSVSYYSEGMPLPAGTVLTVDFTLDGQKFTAINGGPEFHFSEAISFLVDCETQAEVDYLWDKLGAGGEEQQCGWLKDKYGLSWQIVPSILGKLMSDPDGEKVNRVMQAMLQMVKLDISKLQAAYDLS